MLIYVFGRGAFARSLVDNGNEILAASGHAGRMMSVETCKISEVPSCIVHAGSGRQLKELIALCQCRGIALIQAATGMPAAPSHPSFVYIDAPNLSIPIVKCFRLMKEAGALFSSAKVSIEESHQESKTSVPGTAKVFADAFGVPLDQIKSIRNPEEQKQRGVPEAFLSGHALHWIVCEQDGVKLTFQTEVLGRKTYAHGMIAIAKLAAESLLPGYYRVEDLDLP